MSNECNNLTVANAATFDPVEAWKTAAKTRLLIMELPPKGDRPRELAYAATKLVGSAIERLCNTGHYEVLDELRVALKRVFAAADEARGCGVRMADVTAED